MAGSRALVEAGSSPRVGAASSLAEAASLVRAENAARRATEAAAAAAAAKPATPLELESVSATPLHPRGGGSGGGGGGRGGSGGGGDGGGDDDDVLGVRAREVRARLARKETEVAATAARLAELRESLSQLEEPLKAEIFALRVRLEEANRQEAAAVDGVNRLRAELRDAEAGLTKCRTAKAALCDQLIEVMADYEQRKSERLEEINAIIGGGEPAAAAPGAGVKGKEAAGRMGGQKQGAAKSVSSFGGF
ncbi:hypothetical protein MMPV_007823 [Pyropia vietnamensis]